MDIRRKVTKEKGKSGKASTKGTVWNFHNLLRELSSARETRTAVSVLRSRNTHVT